MHPDDLAPNSMAIVMSATDNESMYVVTLNNFSDAMDEDLREYLMDILTGIRLYISNGAPMLAGVGRMRNDLADLDDILATEPDLMQEIAAKSIALKKKGMH